MKSLEENPQFWLPGKFWNILKIQQLPIYYVFVLILYVPMWKKISVLGGNINILLDVEIDK